MFDFLKRYIRATTHADEPVGPQTPLERLHLRLGAFVTLDTLAFRLHRDALLFAPPEGGQRVETYGHVDLGATAALHRYYFTDDAWLQVNITANQIDELKLWIFHDTQAPGTRAAFDRWLEPGSRLGGALIDYAGRQFRRVWGDADAAWVPPVRFVEAVYNDTTASAAYHTVHHAMLYEREVPEAERMEYLLISAELTGDDYVIVYNIGVDVTEADFQIT